MKYTAECPSCSNEFQIAGPTTAEAGLRCPKCDVGFLPENIRSIETREELLAKAEQAIEAQKWERVTGLENKAGSVGILGVLLLVLAGMSFLCGLGAEHSEEKMQAFVGFGAFLSIALAVFVISQLIHIRASIERQSIK